MDAVAMAEYFCGFGNEEPSPAAKCWWDNGLGEGAVERRDLLLILAENIGKITDDKVWSILTDKYGSAWDWEVLPVLLETIFGWNYDGTLSLDFDAPVRHIRQCVREHEENAND